MLCKHCGKKIPLLKRLADAEFCSPAHRSQFMQMEQEAAIARLLQHGSRVGQQAEPAPAKPPRAKSKQACKDEIPAPLAGLLPETAGRPKVKRKTVSRPRLHEWELVRELPQSPLVIQARRMDVAERIPIEAHPARAAQASHRAQAGEVAAAERFEPADVAPLALEAGPSPVRAAAGMRAAEPGWETEGAGCGFKQPSPGLRSPQPAEPALASPDAACPVTPVRTAVDVRADPRAARSRRCAPKMGAGPRSNGRVEETAAAAAAAPAGAVGRESEVEPEPCGMVALTLDGVAAAQGTWRRSPRWAEGPGRGPRAPRTAMEPASMRQTGGLAGIQLAAHVAAAAAHGGQQQALKPKRRLIGPRLKRTARWAAAVSEAPLAATGALPAATAGRVCPRRSVDPVEAAPAEPRFPAVHGEHISGAPELAAAAMRAIPGQSALRQAGRAATPGAPAWAAVESRIPALGLGVERLTAATAEAAGVEADVEAPPLFSRLLPVFASRGLQWRPMRHPGGESAAGAAWALALGRAPATRGSSLTLDHADGSGPRAAGSAVKPYRPWLSIQMPSFNMSSWRSAPADLKWIMMALPMILMIALYSFLPTRTNKSVETASGASSEPTVLSQRVETIRTAIMERAAIKLADDFRSGLGAWQGPAGWAQTWTYTSANYAVPGQMALYQPSLRLRDYVFSFLGQIDRRSINWVVRARDEKNYIAMRIVMTRNGPMPAASLVRYAVANGKPGGQTVLPLPMTFRDGTMQQVEVTVAGDTITTRVMGQIVDSFTEREFELGGVGFFSPKGDRALLRWISVTHQYDYIGRLCALLAPHSVMRQDARRME